MGMIRAMLDDSVHVNRIEPGLVDTSGFIHRIELGRIDCTVCGKFALSRNPTAIRAWEKAHLECCRGRPEELEFCA
jgi:hypothetical protein